MRGSRRTVAPFGFCNQSNGEFVMLNADDPKTVLALRLLKSTVEAHSRPLVLWIGAGASRWLGYPSWRDLALQLRKIFFRSVEKFDNERAIEVINKNNYSALFQMCRDLDSQTYYRFVTDSFGSRTDSDLFRTFVGLLGKIDPLFILTTNVDEALESRMPLSTTVQRTDLSRCIDLLQRRIPFVAKVHGSVSSVQSAVFATDDYDLLVKNNSYLQSLKYIFASCTVVFLGYGVRDSYVVELIQQNTAEMDLFGPGPHFVVTNEEMPSNSLHRIKYTIKLHPDHRAALSILNIIAEAASPQDLVSMTVVEAAPAKVGKPSVWVVPVDKTAYYLSDLAAPGTWQTSQEITAESGDGKKIEGAFGLGFTNDEVPFREATALHDLAVALVCFDYVYLSLSALPRAFIVLGEGLFRELVRQDVLCFIHSQAEIGILFQWQEAIGILGSVTHRGKDGGVTDTLPVRIRRMLQPVPGREQEAQDFIEEIERRTVVYERSDEINLPSLVRSALLMPKVTKLLGIGDAILPTQAPKWLRYPYLRLAHLVQTAALCAEYGIQATKLPFGGTSLTSAAFGVQPAELHADQLASYVSVGNFNSDLGALLLQEMSIMQAILRFRNSAEGASFRREIGQVLAVESGLEFNASVNAGLKRTIPLDVLERAHDQVLS